MNTYTDDDRRAIIENPRLALADKMRLLEIKDAAAYRALTATLQPAVKPISARDIPAKAAVVPWHPRREYGYLAYRELLYGWRDTLKRKFALCRDYAGNKGIGFLQSGVKIEAAFACTGFSNVIAGHDRSKKYFDEFGRLFNIRHKFYQMFKSLKTYDNILVYWRKTGGNPRGKTFDEFAVKPLDEVTVEYVGAKDSITDDGNLVYFDIDEQHKERILRFERSTKPAERQVAFDFREQFPRLYKIYKSHEKQYMLSNADGEYWAVINRDQDGVGLDNPSMEGIFANIETWKALEEGDFVIASEIKKLIVLVTLGETLSANETLPGWLGIDDLPNAGWARAKDFNDIRTAIARRFSQIVYLFAPHHAKIDYKFPDPEVLGDGKYFHALFQILSWLRIGQQFIVGEGGKFQAGEINKVGVQADLEDMRKFVADEFAQRVYAHPTINVNNYPVPDIAFDRDVLKAPKEIRADIELDMKLGMSQFTGLGRRGHPLKREMDLRKFEREEYADLLRNTVDFTGNVAQTGRPPDGEPTDLEPPARREDE